MHHLCVAYNLLEVSHPTIFELSCHVIILEVVRGNVRDFESGGRLFFFSGKEYCQLKNKKRIAEKWKTTFLSR